MKSATRRSTDSPNWDLEPAGLRKVFVLSTLPYPVWHLFSPEGATDPWFAWWLVAGSFLAVGLASLRIAFVERHLLSCFHVCSALVTLHIYLLASLNDMYPLYAVGSVMAVITTLASIRTIPNILAYSGFVLGLGILLSVARPDPLKFAYWGGMLPVCVLFYVRLAVQRDRLRLARESQEQLERRVAERTGELAQANHRLQAEMKERERLEADLRFSQRLEALGRMAGGVAHDFNNLLTAIGIHADLLMDSLPASSPLRDDVARIRKSSEQAARLTQQLLTFARGRGVASRVADVREVIEKSKATLQHLLGEDTEVVFDVDPAPQPVRASPDQVEQVLFNLALNARDAMPSGGVFTVETRVLRGGLPRELANGADQEASAYVLVAATDTGTGMDRETRERAFDPFFSSKKPGSGTGLGLSIVYGIVTQAGGRVRVLSEQGQGARFELYWPLEEGAPLAAGETELDCGSPHHGARILLVENEPDLCDALERTLRIAGYEVVGCESAHRALEIATREPEFDLVVSDVVMAHMSGFELVERLRAIRPHTRLLLVSGYLNHPSLRDREFPPGVGFLPKPFSSSDLIARVREILEGAATS